MSSVAQLLEELARRDIQVFRDGESLRCSGPSHLITPELKTRLAAHKQELLRALDPRPCTTPIDRVLDGPIAWKAESLAPDAGRVLLTEACALEIETLLERLRARPMPLEELRPEDFDLSACRAVMAEAKRQLDAGPGFAVIDRLDLAAMTEEEARGVYWLLACTLARPVPLKWDGTIMRDVADQGKRSMRAVDTTADMNYHTDNSFNVCPPEYVSLLCLAKAKEGGMSKLVSFPSVHNVLRRRAPELLERLYGSFRFNRQGEHAPGEEVTLLRPIFENVGGVLAARMSHFHVRTGQALAGEPLAPEALAAMEMLEAVMNEPGMGFEFWFEPGQIQILDNRRLGHKRTGFSDWPEPERKRRLVRLWLRDSGRPFYNG